MLDAPDEVDTILSHKLTLKYTCKEIEAMKAVASAAKRRSLAEFNEASFRFCKIKIAELESSTFFMFLKTHIFKAFNRYADQLKRDCVIDQHVKSLSNTMLEKDLCRVIEPYSFVEISHIAKTVGLDQSIVEKKLAQMVLDKKISGFLCLLFVISICLKI